jgi:hypothetical protein
VDDAADGKRLVAYVVAAEVELSELRAHLTTRLPAAMIPTSYVLLDELPLTANGKIDHRQLPVAAHDSAVPATPQAEVPTGLEEQIAAVWREVLRVGQVGLDDTFFELGGHSLLLLQVQRKLTRALGRQVPSIALFAHPTIRKLAAHLRKGDSSEPATDAPGDARADERRSGRARLQQRRSAGGAR